MFSVFKLCDIFCFFCFEGVCVLVKIMWYDLEVEIYFLVFLLKLFEIIILIILYGLMVVLLCSLIIWYNLFIDVIWKLNN